MTYDELADALFEYRMDHKPKRLSQQQLADMIGIDRTYLNAIENCRLKPGKKTIYLIKSFLKENGKNL